MSRGPARIEIVPFTAAHLPAVVRFSERTWTRPRSEAFYRWRYLESPSQRVLLALRGEEIVATISAFRRDYLFGRERRTCLETLDWYCLPGLRGSGLGVRVLQAFMKGQEPIVAVGGTEDTLAILPRLRWQRLATATSYLLPLHGASVTEPLRRRFGIPPAAGRALFAVVGPAWFSPRARCRPPDAEVRRAPAIGEEILPLYDGETGYRVLPLPDLPHLRWLTAGFPGAGPFVILHFIVSGALRGWAILRRYESEGQCGVRLVDVYAPRPDVPLYTWMVSESLLAAAEMRPASVDTLTTCPILRDALRRNRFLDMGPVPIHLWPAGLAGPFEPLHLVHHASDGPLIPYAAGGPGEGAPSDR